MKDLYISFLFILFTLFPLMASAQNKTESKDGFKYDVVENLQGGKPTDLVDAEDPGYYNSFVGPKNMTKIHIEYSDIHSEDGKDVFLEPFQDDEFTISSNDANYIINGYSLYFTAIDDNVSIEAADGTAVTISTGDTGAALTVKNINASSSTFKITSDNEGYLHFDLAKSNVYFLKKTSDGIRTIKSQTSKDNKVYNLQGCRVSSPQKGLYIINGKKVLY
ncbi:MAG: hypothetical protein LKG25_04510 [Prevotella sp.]|jgi:hypothetical protein|nr:hypothetical protein [Prevotella sp.]MCI1281837.1 hypothetical protein [Prevotella sp.]